MEIVELTPDEVIPYKNNARIISQTAIDKVAKSIKEFGFKQPIVVDKDYVVIAGHTRLLAAKKLGKTTIPALIADDLPADKVNQYRLMDNRSHQESEWDYDILKDVLMEFKDDGLDLSLTGFDDDELSDLFGETEEKDTSEVIDDDGYCVLVEFESEAEQEQFYQEMEERGLSCKLMT